MIERAAPSAEGVSGGRAIKGKSLREQVVEALRWSIFIGELPPGKTFSVPALAEQFGVSPTPVREAVLDLVQQGLVVALANRGFQVLSPSMEYLRQAMHVRRLLEVPAMLEVARLASRDELLPVRALADTIMRAAERREIRAFVEADYAFHWQLTSLCGNGVLASLIEEMRSRARLVVIPAIATHDLVEIAREHLELLAAIERNDVPGMERVTVAHMERTLDAIRDVVGEG